MDKDTRAFIELIKKLTVTEQAGVLQMIQGARLITESKKKKQ